MAKEISFTVPATGTHYATLQDSVGQWYNTLGSAFEAFNAANWTDYDHAATQVGSSKVYTADMPAVAAGVYSVVAFAQAGGAPAATDEPVAEGGIDWNGSSVVLPLSATAADRRVVVSSLGAADANLKAINDGALAEEAGTNYASAFAELFGQGSGGASVNPAAVVWAYTARTLTAAGLDAVIIESAISAGAGLTNDTGTQLTAINARQAVAAILSAVAAVLAGAATTNVTVKPAGKPAGNTRIDATVTADGNRTAVNLKVPD